MTFARLLNNGYNLKAVIIIHVSVKHVSRVARINPLSSIFLSDRYEDNLDNPHVLLAVFSFSDWRPDIHGSYTVRQQLTFTKRLMIKIL